MKRRIKLQTRSNVFTSLGDNPGIVAVSVVMTVASEIGSRVLLSLLPQLISQKKPFPEQWHAGKADSAARRPVSKQDVGGRVRCSGSVIFVSICSFIHL